MKEKIGSILMFVVSIAFIVLLTIGAMFAFKWGVDFLFNALPVLSTISWIIFLLNIFVFLPLSFFRKTGIVSGMAFYISSYLFGLILFLYSVAVSFILWGWWAIILGVFLMGAGFVPIALLASLFNAEWLILFNILIYIIFTYGFRGLGIYLFQKHDQYEATDRVREGSDAVIEPSE